jgi:hypothetical protein
MSMKNRKYWGIAAFTAGIALTIPGEALAWHMNLPGNICQASLPQSGGFGGFGQWSYSSSLSSNANSGNNYVVGFCPILQGAASVNGSAWFFQDSQTVTLSVNVDVASGDEVSAWACLSNASGGSCGNAASQFSPGVTTLHPDLSEWKSDPNGGIPAYVMVDLGLNSSVFQVFVANY